MEAAARVHGAGLGGAQRAVRRDAHAQRGVVIQHGLQQDCRVGLGGTCRGLHHDRLVELVGGAVDAAQPFHDRGGRQRPDARIGCPAGTLVHLDHAGQPGDGLLDEQVLGPAGQACRPRAGHDLHRRNAVAAEVEERVVHTDALDTEHRGVDAGEDFLGRVRGCAVVARGVLGRRQRANVEFAVGGQRQLRHHDHRGRNHVRRQSICQRDTDRRRVGGSGEVADQALVSGPVFAGDDRGLVHAVEVRQRRLDVAEFDAVAADLDLIIDAAQVIQLAVGAPPHQVTGAVHASAGSAERAGHKARCGQPTASQVACRHARAGQVQLTDDTDRNRP
ncbi:Uncharacterised protein [Mycobacteroides abscessus subsp. abscessus]|nr:Uncharacterised protein [Mycobacteroides abscessus subsp. abscessus]